MTRWGIVIALTAAAGCSDPTSTRISAAASVIDALEEWASRSPTRFTLNFGASSSLARQIEAGAPADIYVSADRAWVRHLVDTGHAASAGVRPFVKNRLVAVARKSVGRNFSALLSDEGVRFVMADPEHVPAGRYGRAALQSMGAWEQIESRTARAADVRAALQFVKRGEADVGFVYATDLEGAPELEIVKRFSRVDASIQYSAVLLSDSPTSAASATFESLTKSATTARIFRSHGFLWMDDQ